MLGWYNMDELSTSVKTIMDTQLSETEVLVYLLTEGGYNAYKIEDLPLGIAKSTAQRIYKKAKAKMDKQAAGGMFQTEVE